MLEGVVARLLNQWLGKYVVDLDTENLNVGIFSGQVQLTELRLKTEALYELDLPIEVKFGTIGKISIEIPWNALLNQPVIIHIEDVHILAGPVVSDGPYDAEKEKRLLRASKRNNLSNIYADGNIIGGPSLFPEHLVTSIINHFQVIIQNIHVRYEDLVSIPERPLAAGLCISSITAETTNNKWKVSNTPKGCQTGYHLLKVESFSVYWNYTFKPQIWDWKTQYYLWRNAMTHSLQTFSMNNIDFDFLIKPMTCKIKFIINKSNGTQALKLLVDLVLQDFTLQISREQFLSIQSVIESWRRMRTSRQFLNLRPFQPITKSSVSKWWKYAQQAVLEQRIRPYTWSRIATVRQNYRLYRDAYKKVLINPNDTELKLDLQKFEDNLSLINIIIAREHAKLMLRIEEPDCENSPIEKGRSFWSMLPSPERGHLCEMIGYSESPIESSNICHYVEHKYNLTISNFSLNLLCNSKEVLVVTLTQVLASAETRSTGNFADLNNFLKISARAEGFIIEGASLEDHLVPLISAEQYCNGGTMTPNVFSMDYETNPAGSATNCKLWCSLEAAEIVFSMHAVSEILNFFDNGTSLTIPDNILDYTTDISEKIQEYLCLILNKRIDLNLDIKIPYLVIPEYGSLIKSGNLLILDIGRVVIRSELTQLAENLEEVTQMELEECAYSRVHIDLFHAQLLFCDSSENWRDARKETDTDMHLISKINTLVVFALCAKPDHKTLPKYKLNITVPSLKINISERKISLLLGFIEHLEDVILPYWNNLQCQPLEKNSIMFRDDTVIDYWSRRILMHVRRSVTERFGIRKSIISADLRRASVLSALTDRSIEPSEYSGEESIEAWARCVDLPGLEDNISPHNNIQNLIRIVLGELCFVLSRSSERVDRPYLMLRIGKSCLDIATMDYGPALQLTIASISLTDKLHTNITGQYLDLIHVPVPSEQDFLMLLYRKVTADCPDFKSHFHSVEKSLVADFGQVHFLVHRDAIRAMVKYAEYLYDKIIKYKPQSATILYETLVNLHSNLKSNHKLDPPVPPGAVKFSNSIRLNLVTARLCDADCDLLDIKISGLECDFMFRANERLVLRSYLSNLYVEHLTDVTLYSKVLTVDEEKVFEVKYVRHAPRPHTGATGILPPQSQRCENGGIMSDGSLRLYVGRMQVTLLYKLMLKLKYFLKPACEWKFLNLFTNWLKGTVNSNCFTTAAKLNLSITIHGPTLLLPQKTASPNLVVINSGELNVENFFKETSPNKSIIENILMKLEGTTILRAVMTLNSSLETQEAILEPMSVRLDIKRAITCPRSANPCAIRPPSWEIDGIIDLVKITLGQRDLTTLLAVYTDNINEGHVAEFSPDSANFPAEPRAISTPVQDDREVRCLEAFFCQVESKYKDICIKLNLEGLELSLFCDCEEILSSPIRDLNHGLCRLEVGDTLFSSDFYSDHSLEAKLSVQSVTIVDIRPESNSFNNTIFQSHRDEAKANTYQISVSTPPVIDVSFHQNNTGDRFVDIIVERVCLTLSVPFLATLGRFIFESLPCERKQEGGIINHGYEADTTATTTATQQREEEQIQIPETKELTGLTIAIRMCKPEIVFLADAQIEKGNSFIMKAEILVDYSRHAMRENLIISLSNFHILFHALRVSEPYILLHPCDFEFSKCFKTEDGIKSTMTLSTLQMHLCSGIILTITDIIDDVYCHLNPPISEIKPKQFYLNRNEEKMDEVTDLWSSKRVSECYASESDNVDLTTESNHLTDISKTFIASISNITVVLELEGVSFTTPVILIQAAFECQLHDWSRQLHGSIEFHLQANYYNEQIERWEPLVEPICTAEGGAYRPYEILVKIFQKDAVAVTENCIPSKDESRGTVRSNSTSGDEDTSSDGGMTFLRPQHSELDKATPRLTTSLAAFLDDSDMDTEDGTMEKLASAICDLFTGDWNESEDSDCGHSSGTEQSCDSESDERRKTITGTTVTTTEKLATYVLIDSRDILNITLTSQAVHLLYDIMISYSDRTVHAVTSTIDKTITLVNDIGPKSKVELLRKSEGETENVVVCSKTFEKLDSGPSSPAKSIDELSLEESVDSNCSDTKLIGLESDWQQDKDMMQSLQFPELTTPEIYKIMNDEQMYVEVPGFLPLYTSCPRRSWQKLLKLQPVLNNTKYYLMAKHVLNRSGRFLTIGSPLKICNETCYPLGLFYERSALAAVGMEAVGEIMNPFGGTVRVIVLEPHDEYNVPLHIAYHCKLYLQPAYIESYQVSSNALWWPDLALDIGIPKDLTCESKSPETDPSVFSLRVLTEEGPILGSISTRQQSRTIPNYFIRLLPPLVLHNSLPYSIDVKIPQIHQQVHIDGGATTTLYSLNIQKTVKLSVEFNYLGLLWTGGLNLTIDLDEKVLSMVTDYDTEGGNKQLTINVKIERTQSCELFFYAPYWIVNKTGLPLQIRGCVSNMVYDSSHGEEIILFSFKRQAKQAVRVRAYQSSWSAEFSLDAVGTSGLVVARDKERNRRYPMLLSITLSKMSPNFTKIVTFLPNFLVQNNTKKHLRFMEENERTDLWLDLTPGQCVPFWPETQSMQMYIKYRDSKVVSQNFSIARVHQTVLRMDKGGAVNVEVRGGHTQPFSITFKCYKPGDAPCRVDNMCCDLHLKVHQRAQGQVTLISPQHSLLYTWDDPCADRMLVWNVYNNKGVGYPLDIHTDGYGEVRIRLHTVKPGSVNITIQQQNNPTSSSSSSDDDSSEEQQPTTTHLTKKTMRHDKVVVYWLCYMDGPQRAVMFTQDHRMAAKYRKRVHFERCDWEVCFSLAGVGLSLCLSQPTPMEFAYASLTDSPALWEVNIAHKWKMLTLELASWVEDKYKSQQKKCQLKDYVHIDFDKMYMVKPFYGELRRTYYPAVSLQYRRSDSHQFYRLKLNSFQVENEPRANIQFRILHPLINGVSKPFAIIPCIEYSCFKKHSATFEYDIYKSVTMDIQEFYVNIDRVFVERLASMFEDWIGQKDAGMNIRADMNLVHMPLSSMIVQTSTTTNKAIIERLTLSPIHLQLVLSTTNHPSKRKSSTCDLVDYMFSCLENSYSPVKQAKYSMISYEMEKMYTNIEILFVDVINHYSSQLLQQFHVNILGQQVLLNPFGYTVSKTSSSTSESEQQFTIGLDVERVCRCLLGHVHGSQSLQTLTLGRGEYPFVHSFDQEYRRRRRYTPTHIANFPETLSIVNRAFLVGVTFGFTGLFPPSTSGGQCCNGGVDGFFKGSGKALASLMTRGGVTDCVDVAYDAIRRAIIMGERICVRHRLHRYINTNTAIKPFSYYEAMGQNLLMTIANGRYADTDKYWAHGSLNTSGKQILLITLQHIFLVENIRQWSPWEIEWMIELDDVVSVPKITGQQVIINVRQDENNKEKSNSEYSIKGDLDILRYLKDKMEQALVISMEDKCWISLEH